MFARSAHRQGVKRSGGASAYRVVGAQFGVTLLSAALFAVFSGVSAGYAALAGGLVNVLANMYFALKLFGSRRVKSSGEMVMAFFVGEFVKLTLAVGLMFVALAVLKLAFVPFFTTFLVTLSVLWLAVLPQLRE